jgi:hypothetical protein
MAVEEPVTSAPPIRLRLIYALVQASWLLIVRTGLQATGRAEVKFMTLELQSLPFPTEVVLIVSDALRSGGYWGLVLVTGVLVLLAWRGSLDRRLPLLIRINWIAMSIILPIWALALLVPLYRAT